MWGINKNNKQNESRIPVSEKAAASVGGMINRVQSKFGTVLNNKTSNLSKRGKIILFICFSLLFGGSSVCLIVKGITNSVEAYKNPTIRSITVPKHYDKTGMPGVKNPSVVSPAEMNRIRFFRRYMDSLSRSTHGSLLYDSIIRERPGLLDSISQVERMYMADSLSNSK
jgi:hypothetical protein